MANLLPVSVFVLAVLVVYRLALLVSQDILTDGLRKRVGRWAAGQPHRSAAWYVAELLNCAYCTGVWFALAVALYLAFQWRLGVLSTIALWLALAGAQAFLFSLGRR